MAKGLFLEAKRREECGLKKAAGEETAPAPLRRLAPGS